MKVAMTLNTAISFATMYGELCQRRPIRITPLAVGLVIAMVWQARKKNTAAQHTGAAA